jgi:hypothetical protein
VPSRMRPALNTASTSTPQVWTDTVSGRPAADIARLYRADGFEVQVVDLDVNPPGSAATAAFWTAAALIGETPGHVTDPRLIYPRLGK